MILVDASMLAHRTHAKMDFLKNSAGIPTGMEFGFLRTIQVLQKKLPNMTMSALIAHQHPNVNGQSTRTTRLTVSQNQSHSIGV